MNAPQWLARLACRAWIGIALWVSSHGRAARPRSQQEPLILAVLAPLAGANWIEAYVRPILAADRHNIVTVFASTPIRAACGVLVVSPPRWAVALLGNVAARTLWTLVWMMRFRPEIVIGLHLPWNGLLALLIARTIGAEAWYFCVGGPQEFLDGGIHSENALFVATGEYSTLREWQLLRLINRFDRVLTMGTLTKDQLKKHGVMRPIEPVGVGIDLQKFRRPRAAAKTIDVIAIARLAPIKRLDVLLRAVALLKQQDGNAPHTSIIGSGPELARLQALAARLRITDEVRFAGWCEDVEQSLRHARVFVLASKSEGLPISMLEAMASGVPCVVPSTGDIEDAVRDGDAGILMRHGTAEELAAGIRTVLSLNEAEYARMSSAAVASAARFSVEAKRRQWIELLTSTPRAISTMTSTRAPAG